MIVIGDYWTTHAEQYTASPPRFPDRLWAKPKRPADPAKKAARKRQRKARAITRRSEV